MPSSLSEAKGSYIESHRIRRILIVKLSSLGDVIHALPVAGGLKKAFPFLKLHWVVEDRCAPLLADHPFLDSVLVFPRQEIQYLMKRGKWGEVLKRLGVLRRSLRRLGIDLSLDLQGLAKSGLIAWMAAAPHRLGCPGMKEFSFLVSKRVLMDGQRHVVESHLRMAEFLGAKVDRPECNLAITAEEQTWADAFLKEQTGVGGDRLIGLHIGSRPPAKCWPLEKHRIFLERIREIPRIRPILFGDVADGENLSRKGLKIPEGVINTVGDLSLRQLMALIARCQVFIGGDSGPLHLAAGLGVPTIALFGGTDPGWSAPYGEGHTVLYKHFSCSPCLLTPKNKPCICNGRYGCMDAIEVEEVLASLKAALELPTHGLSNPL